MRSSQEWTRAAGVVADILRATALVSAVVTTPTQPAEVPLRFALIFAALLVTRTFGIPRPFDAGFALLLLATGWASALGWYVEHSWIDIPIHFALTGTTAAVLYVAAARLDLLPKPNHPSRTKASATIVIVVVLLGATTSLVWELYEWLAENYLPSRILVGYDDTAGDMTNGLLGSLVAGALMAAWQRAGHDLRARR